MSGPIRIFEGRFGRVSLEVAAAPAAEVAGAAMVLKYDGADGECSVRGERQPLTREDLLLVNPGESFRALPGQGAPSARLLMVRPACDWIGERFPALRESSGRLFPRPHETATARIRRLADALTIEILNDQFLASERIEFMLQELMLSIVETYLARRRASSPLWRGSRFSDQRIRRAIALLRANPNKDVNIDQVASEVGLSRSRFYDLFQLCTGHSPRAYLDMLCVEAAIARLADGGGRIADVSAELGFSAQSNFTRFFLSQVGIPPSTYRRASAQRTPGKPPDEDPSRD